MGDQCGLCGAFAAEPSVGQRWLTCSQCGARWEVEPYPECKRMQAVTDRSQAIGEFLDWLYDERGIVLAERDRREGRLWALPGRPWTQLLAQYFDIDLERVDDEKRHMLEALRGPS